MSFLKDKWTERQVLDLTQDEHGFLERKAGKLLDDRHAFYTTLAKALSAFANSGGGHIILGQQDDGSFDGLPALQGSTPIREWLEQVLPTLVFYSLEAIRVHAVERITPSKIPPGREVIVVDIGDSRLSPHQATFPKDNPQYFYRPAGKSVPAPHHFLEALRNRMTFAVLQARLDAAHIQTCSRTDYGIQVEIRIRFLVKNISRVACAAWSVACWAHVPNDGIERCRESGVNAAITLLPTSEQTRLDVFPIRYDLSQKTGWFVRTVVLPTEIHFYPVAEAHVGELVVTKLADVLADVNDFEKRLESRVKNM